jgi:hypothetical protein
MGKGKYSSIQEYWSSGYIVFGVNEDFLLKSNSGSFAEMIQFLCEVIFIRRWW